LPPVRMMQTPVTTTQLNAGTGDDHDPT
jgi:hypothetical protein